MKSKRKKRTQHLARLEEELMNNELRLYEKAKGLDLIDGVCKACSNKMGTLDAARDQGLRLLDEMTGHPSMARYMEEGFEVITF